MVIFLARSLAGRTRARGREESATEGNIVDQPAAVKTATAIGRTLAMKLHLGLHNRLQIGTPAR